MAFSEFNRTLTGFRKGGGAYLDGIWTPSNPVGITIRTSVQPASSKDLELLPEGRREEAAYRLFTKSELVNGDILSIFGIDHEILQVSIWQNGIIPHYSGLAVRVQTEGVL